MPSPDLQRGMGHSQARTQDAFQESQVLAFVHTHRLQDIGKKVLPDTPTNVVSPDCSYTELFLAIILLHGTKVKNELVKIAFCSTQA